MAGRFLGTAAVAGIIIFSFASATQAQGPASLEIPLRKPANMTIQYIVRLDTETCRDDLLEDRGQRCNECGWETNICQVQETSAECNGTGFGKCTCTQTMRIDAATATEPPFTPDIDPAHCYSAAIEVECVSHADNIKFRGLAAGNFCVFEDIPFFKAYGSGMLPDNDEEPVMVRHYLFDATLLFTERRSPNLTTGQATQSVIEGLMRAPRGIVSRVSSLD